MRRTGWNPVTAILGAVFLLCVAAGPRAGEITAENWTEKVGFAPDLETCNVAPGKKITKKNVDQVAACIPPGMQMWIKDHGLKLKVRAYKPYHPSEGYIEATNKYLGQPRILDTGDSVRKVGLAGYTAGLPFPNPKSGTEVGWNQQYNYSGDDQDTYFTVFWVSTTTGIEHSEYWRWAFIMRTINRTDVEPIPAIPRFKEKNLQYASITYAIEPYDKKGFGAFYTRSVEPLDMQGHIYVPAMRRVLRNTFGTRGDSWNSTDFLYEDLRGYMGYPEWMEWKLLGKKTVYLPVRAGITFGDKSGTRNYDLKKPPYCNPKYKYEPRPVYVVEVIPKLTDYPYSKQIFYVDAEMWYVMYKESFDRKGELWKIVILGINESPDMDTTPPLYGGSVVVDFQADHATITNFTKVIPNSDPPAELFTLSSLRKRGR